MTSKKLFLVNKLSLEERLNERILKEFVEQVRRENHDLFPVTEEHQIQIFQVLIDKVFNECFSQKNSVELSPSDLELLKICLKGSINLNKSEYTILINSIFDGSRKALLKKLEALEIAL